MDEFNYFLLTCWDGFDHELCEVLLLELLEHRVGRAASAFGCGSSWTSASRTAASATSPPPATGPGGGGRSGCCLRNGSWKKKRRKGRWWGTSRNSRREDFLWCCWGHGVNRSQVNRRQKRIRLRVGERLLMNTSHTRLIIIA